MLNKEGGAKRRQLIVGNWKMNGTHSENANLLNKIIATWEENAHPAEVVVCPPHPYLQQVGSLLNGCSIQLGAQTVSEFEKGAYTGEVSAQMLADLDCKFVIIGHNERRRLQRETDTQIAQKFLAVQRAGLTPILCVGESLEERENCFHLEAIASQLQTVFNLAGKKAFLHAIVAYEPIWAVGTGKTALPEQVEQVHHFIREQLGSDIAALVRILYGGSVRSHNAEQLFALPDIDGALLGGASLDAEEFLNICKAAHC